MLNNTSSLNDTSVLFPEYEREMQAKYYVNGKQMKENEDNKLDQFFTDTKVAKSLYEKARTIISKYEEHIEDFLWIEPSVGNGSFYDLFPNNRRIGIDICPLREEFIQSDYLQYNLPEQKSIVMGNPPFGNRGVIALDFINHSQKADYVCFILPMFFDSRGKGSIKYRVKGFNLIHTEKLPQNTFYSYTTKKFLDVKCVFQVWSKKHSVENEEFSWYKDKCKEPFQDIVSVYTVSLAKKRECGKRWIIDNRADFYISSTFHDKVSIVYNFDEVKYKSGVAIVFNTTDEHKRQLVKDVLEKADWKHYTSLATNSCYHIGKSNIFQLLKDKLKL